MPQVVSLAHESATEADLVGGKGASLARLTRAEFPVPPGFVVTTGGYERFIEESGLVGRITAILDSIDYADAPGVETRTREIRSLIEQSEVPASLREEILASYAALGEGDRFVAVRSSGTAEDLAEASFAGQHDSYLDVLGGDQVVDAVRRCWASLWTARATAYRARSGFDHRSVSLAVVVQVMVASEVSGVMFTANPMSTAVDEFVVNASYGLGEGIVSGILTPDQFTVDRDNYQVVDRLIGAKEKQVVRDPATGHGTVVEAVPETERDRPSLTDAQLARLARLGAKATEYYGGWPQDLEWGLVDDTFYLLQSRDITGVDFSWDEDLEDYCPHLERTPRDAVLSRAFSDAVWQGRITPMGYSLRGEAFQPMMEVSQNLWGSPHIAGIRAWKYHKGEAYFDGRWEWENAVHFVPPALRSPALLQWTPPSWLDDLQNQPGSWTNYARALIRIRSLDPDNGPYRWFKNCEWQWENRKQEMLGPGPEELRDMSDAELRRQVDRAVRNQKEWVEDLWSGFFVHATTLSAAFFWMLQNWYGGTDPMMFTDLITGLPEPTITLKENLELWALAEKIRNSPSLTRRFEERPGAAFFTDLDSSEEGRDFLAAYREFLVEFGHRGHADRDVSYLRRSEDPALDYNSLKAFLTAGGARPGATEDQLIARRIEATEEVVSVIRKQPFGWLKAELFKLVHEWLLKFFVLRDNERHHTDRGTWAKKKAVEEVGRRLVQRGVLDAADDYLYLSKRELMRLFDGATGQERLTRAKIAGRRRNVENYRKDGAPPRYILGNGTVTSDGTDVASGPGEDGVLRGVGTSRGTYTGTARVVPEQKDLHRVQAGDILITHSTDPGWTTVFLVLKGLVLETGGMLAHGSCISREYGIPAVQINDAMRYIPDGATITVNGDTGEVTVLEVPDAVSVS
jgi:pyruvate,water dikinase